MKLFASNLNLVKLFNKLEYIVLINVIHNKKKVETLKLSLILHLWKKSKIQT